MNGRLSPPGPYGSGKMRFGPGLGYTKLMQVGLVGCVKKKAGSVRAAEAAGASVEIVGEGLPIGKLLSFYTNHERQFSPTRHRLTEVTPALLARHFATRAGPLAAYLESAQSPTMLTFDEIESLIGTGLPPSARNHRAWWTNSKDRTLAREWLAAGWRAESVDLIGGWIRLLR
ncbi:MAG: hypothetical protein QOD49_2846 [Actinomycetota bacterium]|nr:hypothetical protein [Actinomycetota bacterium]